MNESIMQGYSNTKIGFFIEGARRSKDCASQWFRYLRKAVDNGMYSLNLEDVDILINSGELSMYQTITLKRAVQQGTPTNQYVVGLNQRARTPMLDELLRRHGHAR